MSGIAVQRLLRALSNSMDASLSETERFKRARDQIRKLENAPDGHFANYPKARDRLKKILQGTSSYALHEYTVASWEPMLLSDVASALSPLGLTFVGSADPDVRSAFQAIDDRRPEKIGTATSRSNFNSSVLREAMRDFEIDRQFRCDLFVRGAVVMNADESIKLLGEQRFALTLHPDVVEIIHGNESDAEEPALCRDVLNAFAILSDGVAAPIDIAVHLKRADPDTILRSVLLCAGAGALHPVGKDRDKVGAIHARKLNNFMAMDRTVSNKINIAASPVVGSGVPRFSVIPAFEEALSNGAESPTQLIQSAVSVSQSKIEEGHTALKLLKQAAHYMLKSENRR